MPTLYQPLFPDSFLAATWAKEYTSFRGSPAEAELLQRLTDWATKKPQKETAAEGAFVGIFFKQTWGYRAAGEGSSAEGHSCEPKYAIGRAGERGGTGAADLALGFFDRPGVAPTPQVLCEFKDVRSGLDKPQRRKGNDRSPVKQCADYLREARAALYGNEPILPTWAIVSDMNEFRLYWQKSMPAQHQRFILKPVTGDSSVPLLGDDDDARFQRFVFWKLFQSDSLLTTGGPSAIEKLLTQQGVHERAIESDFYQEYQSYREEVFNALIDSNPDFKGTRGKLVRLTQRFLDRCIFVLFCEDMGAALNFPPHILREVLAGVSTDPDYDPTDDAAWTKVKKLFAAMRDGSPFRDKRINRFNGGLFAAEPDLETLHIPTRLFCAKGQGSLSALPHKKTLLFFSARYNFGVSGGTFERTISLYTLGRIFEQSITELEFMEAKAEGRPSITELSKRKRDGVYYTPEWITNYVVEETIGALLAELRQRLGLDPMPTFPNDELENYRRARASGRKDRRFKTERVEQYMASLDQYGVELDAIKVVDPACGSGAFLIQALDRLVNERRWLAGERERIIGTPALFDTDAVTKGVLSNNIYGVDINEESIELTRLALWLHTALPDRPLSALNDNIRCGNSLVDREFYKINQESLFNEEERERINAFDWRVNFPKVFGRAKGKNGFDCVIGNPPYVKLQHFRRVLPLVAEYLVSARCPDGPGPLYASTQTQNFDMYLPFIERGIELLNAGGRMGYIAPSVWLRSEYGEGLRTHLRQTHRLERWVDFKDYPVFDEAMTYTALQFYRGQAVANVACIFAPDGKVDAIDWLRPDSVIMYADLPSGDRPWLLLPQREQIFIERLNSTCTPLGKLPGVQVGVRGVETGADEYYHFHRVGPGRWVHAKSVEPNSEDEEKTHSKNASDEVELEEELLRPLVSGPEARRFVSPSTDTFVLFPYRVTERAHLISQRELEDQFPLVWAYFKKHERVLRDRERGRMNRDDGWWGYNYPKNMDKHHLPKLGVAQTVPEMRVFYDERGAYCFNNVRVGGILTGDADNAFWLLGVLNSRVVDFVFRRIAKPKEPRPSGAYFEANKQYLEPLPIPTATSAEQGRVANIARELQTLHTARRDTTNAINQLLSSSQLIRNPRPHKWLWADVGDVAHWSALNPESLKGRMLKDWAKQVCHEKLTAHLAELAEAMSLGAPMVAVENDGELKFYVGDRCIISDVYVSEQEAPVLLAQWQQKARGTFVSNSMNAAKLVEFLLDLKTTENATLTARVKKSNSELKLIESRIRIVERELDDLVYCLYRLSEEERRTIEKDTRSRWDARMPMPPKL